MWRQFFAVIRFGKFVRILFEGKKVVAEIYQIFLVHFVLAMKFGCTYFYYSLDSARRKKNGIVLMYFRQVNLDGKKKEMRLCVIC